MREAEAAGVAVLRGPGAERVLVRGGAFTMGSDELEVALALASCQQEPQGNDCREEMFGTEYPAHEVFLSDYWIDRTEVTVASYERCVEAGRCQAPPFASGGERFSRPEYPVTLVTWYDAHAYCAWSGGRLPTEAEWERAARGARGRRFPWGMVWNPHVANHGALSFDDLDRRDGFLELAPVGSFPDGRTPDGIEDLAGNADEWIADWYSPEYPKESSVNPTGPDVGDLRVVRGGAYGGYREGARSWLRSAARWQDLPSLRHTWRGFRCALPS